MLWLILFKYQVIFMKKSVTFLCKIMLFFYLQNSIFFIVSDDMEWAQENIENTTNSVFFAGSQKSIPSSQADTFNEDDQRGFQKIPRRSNEFI
jgi:hypothetical protein